MPAPLRSTPEAEPGRWSVRARTPRKSARSSLPTRSSSSRTWRSEWCMRWSRIQCSNSASRMSSPSRNSTSPALGRSQLAMTWTRAGSSATQPRSVLRQSTCRPRLVRISVRHWRRLPEACTGARSLQSLSCSHARLRRRPGERPSSASSPCDLRPRGVSSVPSASLRRRGPSRSRKMSWPASGGACSIPTLDILLIRIPRTRSGPNARGGNVVTGHWGHPIRRPPAPLRTASHSFRFI